MTDRTPTSDPVAAAWEGLHDEPDILAAGERGYRVHKAIREHRPFIEEAIRQQARAAFAAQPRTWESMYAEHVRLRDAIHAVATVASDPGPTDSHPHYCHFDCAWFADLVLERLAASPEPASPEAPGSGLDVERLARAMEDVFPGWLEEAPGTAEAQTEMRSYAEQLDAAYRFLYDSAAAGMHNITDPNAPLGSGLAEAWKAAEDALPEGWWIELRGPTPNLGYHATAMDGLTAVTQGWATSPAAALLALADRLAARPDGAEADAS